MPFEELDHPSDAYVHAWGQSWTEALGSALDAMYLQAYDELPWQPVADRVPDLAKEEVVTDGGGEGEDDDETMRWVEQDAELVAFDLLNEALFRLATRGVLLRLDHAAAYQDPAEGGWVLSTRVHGVRPTGEPYGEVKAVTRHRLRMVIRQEGGDGPTVQLWVIFDL